MNQNIKVHEWIAKYTEEGNLNIVTGYFTVGALAYLSRAFIPHVDQVPYTIRPVGRLQADQHDSAKLDIAPLKMKDSRKKRRFTCSRNGAS